ncbi:hypothetical protein PVAND_011895 [Polypedilum vanderplanki]|uniref:Odorant receptor n=1 Tax=Polypedilum vanderplanki TaxID=319348 RepID=A0A9J6CKS1_POLVA|nr:hypothetical protein PVAND_011895 [Polypedilum vanderplanki]
MASIWSYGLSSVASFVTYIINPTDNRSEILSYQLFYPFDELNYLLTAVIHLCAFGHFFQIVTLLMNQLLIYTTIYLSSCFDRLCENIRETINNTDQRSVAETKQHWAKCVEIHEHLVLSAVTLNKLFGPFLVLFIVEASILICFLGFMSITEEPVVAATFFGAMINHLFDVFILCYIGEKLKTSSTDIAEEISRSDLHKVDKYTAKNVIIMVSMSQRPINLSAMGLFTYEHTNFSEVCSKSYSYMSILKRFY